MRILGRAFSVAVLALLSACQDGRRAETPKEVSTEAPASFDASAAWDEFEDTIRLYYAYLERGDFDVEAQLARSKTLASAAKTDAAFRRILHRTAYAFTDPHFIVGPFESSDYNIIPTSSDLKVAWKDGRLEIVDIRQGSAAASAKLQPGWFIVEIDGESSEAASRRPFGDVVLSPTAKQLDYGANLAVNGRRAEERELSMLTHQGRIEKIVLSSPRDYALQVSRMPLLTTKPETEFFWLYGTEPKSLGYIRINNHLGNNDLIKAFDEAIAAQMDTRALVLDLRNTPSGGNTEVARSIMGHFISATKSYQIHEIPSLEREFTVPRRFIEQVKPRAPYYGKPVIVLGGHWTGSMGEGLVMGMDAAAGAHTITSDMGDLLGALRNFNMSKSSARVDIGTEALFHVNGTPREDYAGDMQVTASDNGQLGRSDRGLAKARAYLREAAQD